MHLSNLVAQITHGAASEPDVFIVGGGPAGLACAIAAARLGLTVEVADGMAPPIDKACGEGLMPDTIAALSQLGIDLTTAESAPFRGIRFLAGHPSQPTIAQAAFPETIGRGIRRPILHQLLVDRATELGVRLSWQTVVRSIKPVQSIDPTQSRQTAQKIKPGKGSAHSIVHTNRHTVHPRFIIGADGHQSRVRSWSSLDRGSISGHRRIGLRQHFTLAPQNPNQVDFVEVHWSDHGQAYVTPISSGEVCVAFVAAKKFLSVPQALSHFPQLQQRLRSAIPSGSPRGAITLSRKLHRVTHGNVALVGDASGSVDAVTGEGLGLCFRQALVLAEALRSGNLEHYQQAHRTLRRLPSFMARAMLLLDASPRLRDSTLNVLQSRPQLFEQLLRIHIGHAPVRLFGSTGLLATGAHLIAG